MCGGAVAASLRSGVASSGAAPGRHAIIGIGSVVAARLTQPWRGGIGAA